MKQVVLPTPTVRTSLIPIESIYMAVTVTDEVLPITFCIQKTI